jgi:hypothetical protein
VSPPLEARCTLLGALGSLFVLAGCGSDAAATRPPVVDATLVSIALDPAGSTIDVGAAQRFRAYGWYSDVTSRELTPQVVWSSSDPAVATIAADGVAVAHGPGVATIEAIASSGKRASASLAVRAISSLGVTPSVETMPAGLVRHFQATATYSDGTSHNVSGKVAWSSSDPSVADVRKASAFDLEVIGFAPGEATLTATLSDWSASALVSVTPATVDVLDITPYRPTLAVGETRQLDATAHFTDGTQQVVSSSPDCDWAFETETSAATLSPSGLVTGVEPGYVVIYATYAAAFGSLGLEIVP